MSGLFSVDDWLRISHSSHLARLDAQLLLGHVMGKSRTWLIINGDAMVDDDAIAEASALAMRLQAGEPLAYLLGRQEFHGLMLAVDNAVLAPRPDTETLVDWALEVLRGPLAGIASPRVLDLGTGSGAIALSIKHECPNAEVQAYDESESALTVARSNAATLGLRVQFARTNWFDTGMGPGDKPPPFHLVLSNPPYLADDDPHLPGLEHEPQGALVAGVTGLEDLEAIVADTPLHLAPGGWLLLEHGYTQGAAVRALFASATWRDVATRRDLAGHERCTGGRFDPP